MSGDSTEGRVLVVASTGWAGGQESGEPFVYGDDDCSSDEDGRADAETDRGDVTRGPQAVADDLAERLPFDVVVKHERIAPEYRDELSPTLDCVVVLGDAEPLGDPVADVSVPTVIRAGPVADSSAEADPDAATVDGIAAEIRAAVRDERTRSDLRDRNRRLTALNEFARDIAGCETVDAVFERTIEAATDALAFDHCVIMLADGDRFVPRASALPGPELDPYPVTEGVAGRTLDTGETQVVADMHPDPDAVVQHDFLHGLLSVPIGSTAAFQVASRGRDAFDDHDRKFAEILAGYTGEALARIEREAGLRAECDRLYTFYAELPLPALRVERRAGELVVADANDAYESAFDEVPIDRTVADVVPTAAERELYATAIEDGRASGSVTRPADDGGTREYTLTAVPVAVPDGSDSVFGLYT